MPADTGERETKRTGFMSYETTGFRVRQSDGRRLGQCDARGIEPRAPEQCAVDPGSLQPLGILRMRGRGSAEVGIAAHETERERRGQDIHLECVQHLIFRSKFRAARKRAQKPIRDAIFHGRERCWWPPRGG